MAFGTIFGVLAIIAALWVIYDVLVNNKRLSDGMKVLWIICAVIFSIITAVIYYLVGRNNQNDLFRINRR
ncbi:MAG: PLDc N-terminal domain-containing protein [Candidatus Pacearchaeota archaeon]|nr:PLDc N-terminal domain-containing protein [Candidatus Pacearchaeota archaeon]